MEIKSLGKSLLYNRCWINVTCFLHNLISYTTSCSQTTVVPWMILKINHLSQALMCIWPCISVEYLMWKWSVLRIMWIVFTYLACMHAKSLPLCLTLCNPMDFTPPGSSVHGILQARILEWVAMPFSRGSSWPRDRTQVSRLAGGFFTYWAIRESILCTLIYLLTTR